MSKRNLPPLVAVNGRAGLPSEAPDDALARWQPAIRAAGEDPEQTISILDVIGEDPWTGAGVTAKRVAGALRGIGARDVTVNINSPGGDFFEGLAIYNLLREHPHAVNVRVLGIAASAASVIAMAGDRIEVPRAGFFMIHNSWAVALGNRHDLRAMADMLEPFDQAMVDVYAARTGGDAADIAQMMDRETWIPGSQAVEKGFADAFLASDSITQGEPDPATTSAAAAHRIDTLLARAGVSRTRRRELIREVKSGTPGAADPATQNAGNPDLREALAQLKDLNIPTFGD